MQAPRSETGPMDGLALIVSLIAIAFAFSARAALRAADAARRGIGSAADPAGAGCPSAIGTARASARGARARRAPPAEQPQIERAAAPDEPRAAARRAASPCDARARRPGRSRDHAGGAVRHALGCLGRRAGAGARRGAAGALFDRAGLLRPGACASASAPPSRSCSLSPASGSGAPSAPPGARHPVRPHPRHPDRRGHGQRLRHGLCGARALPVHRFRRGLRHAGRSSPSPPCLQPRCTDRRWPASALPALWWCRCWSPRSSPTRGRSCCIWWWWRGPPTALARLRRWLWLAAATVAGAVLWGFALLAAARQRHARRMGFGAARPYRPAARPRSRVHGHRAAPDHRRCRRRAGLDRDPGAGRPGGARHPGSRRHAPARAVDALYGRRAGHPGRDRLAQRTGRRGSRAGGYRGAGGHRAVAGPQRAARARACWRRRSRASCVCRRTFRAS